MSSKALSVAEAKSTLSDAIREVEAGQTIVITRHGKPVAAIVRAADVATLARIRAAGPKQGLASIAGGWADSEELVKQIVNTPRRGRRQIAVMDD